MLTASQSGEVLKDKVKIGGEEYSLEIIADESGGDEKYILQFYAGGYLGQRDGFAVSYIASQPQEGKVGALTRVDVYDKNGRSAIGSIQSLVVEIANNYKPHIEEIEKIINTAKLGFDHQGIISLLKTAKKP